MRVRQTSLGHTFIGDYVQDQMQGLGIYIFSNGDECVSCTRAAYLLASSLMSCCRCRRYQGEFLAGKFHGKGAFKTKVCGDGIACSHVRGSHRHARRQQQDRLVEGLFREGVYAGPDPDAQVVDESQ